MELSKLKEALLSFKALETILDSKVKANLENPLNTINWHLQHLIKRRELGITVDEVKATSVENSDLKQGEYVFALKWSDCDPCDAWCVGFVDQVDKFWFTVVGEDGLDIPNVGKRGWRYFIRIDQKTGSRILHYYGKTNHSTDLTWRADVILGQNGYEELR